MTEAEIITEYNLICNLVLKKKLKMAFDHLTILLSVISRGDWTDKKIELEQNYMLMLKYVINGAADPKQEEIYNKLRTDILKLAGVLYNAIETTTSKKTPYEIKRNLGNQHEKANLSQKNIDDYVVHFKASYETSKLLRDSKITIQGAENSDLFKKHDDVINSIFNRLWLKALYNDFEIDLTKSILESDEAIIEDKSLIISALTLGLTLLFDPNKIRLLIFASKNQVAHVRIRAIAGLFLTLNLYNQRLGLYTDLTNELKDLCMDSSFENELSQICIQYLNCFETEKISKEIREEIIPNLIKNAKMNVDLSKLINNEGVFDENNPAWKDEHEISDKMLRFTQLQNEGSDVYMDTFSSLKNYAFFEKVPNWFAIFSVKNNAVKEIVEKKDMYTFVELLDKNFSLCDSDKFSLLFSFSLINDSNKNDLLKALDKNKNQIVDLMEGMSQQEKTNILIQQYWHDLYRFFKLYKNRKDFLSPFDNEIKIDELFFVKYLRNKNDILKRSAEFSFQKRNYTKAFHYFSSIAGDASDKRVIYEKMGVCCLKLGKYDESLFYLEQASQLGDESQWIMQKIAYCNFRLHRYAKALNYYEKIIETHENDQNTLIRIGQCLIGLKQYAKATDVFFKIDYLMPDQPQIYRSIAWCEFLCKQFDKANTYLHKINEKDMEARDYINIAYIHLCQNNIPEAISYLKKAQVKIGDKKNVAEIVEDDLSILLSNGADKSKMPFILDKLSYEL